MRTLLAPTFFLSILLLTSCKDEQDNSTQNGRGLLADEVVARRTIRSEVRSIRLHTGGVTSELNFSSDTFVETAGGAQVQSGTFHYTQSSTQFGTVVLDGTAGQITIALTFTGLKSGTFRYTQGREGVGNFELIYFRSREVEPPTPPTYGSVGVVVAPGGDNPTPNQPRPPIVVTNSPVAIPVDGPPPIQTPQPQPATRTGLAPAQFSDLSLVLNWTSSDNEASSQAHIVSFASNTFQKYTGELERMGTYTYTADGNFAFILLTYTAPAAFHGQAQQLHFTFTENDSGTITSQAAGSDGNLTNNTGTFELLQN